MGFNFPNSPTPGQLYTPVGGYQYVYLDGVWRVVEAPQDVGTAQARNRVVNGAMQVSQENGDTAGGANGYHPADQWHVFANGITWSTARQVVAGEPNNINFGGTKATIAATDYLYLRQLVEGVRVKDFLWGTAGALPAVLRFDAKCTLAGTYSVVLQNADFTRSFVAAFTVATPNTWATYTIIVPGDTTGTWLITTGVGVAVVWSHAMGSNFLAAAGWNAGNKLGVTGMSNGIATSSSLYVRNVSLHLDPLATGIAPPWVMPDEAEELRACQRYWQKQYVIWGGYATSGFTFYTTFFMAATPRTTPAFTSVDAGAVAFPATTSFSYVIGGLTGVQAGRAANATAANGYWQSTVTCNARM